MAIDADFMKQIIEQHFTTGRTREGQWKPEDGKTSRIRILPFDHTVTAEDIATGHFNGIAVGTTLGLGFRTLRLHYLGRGAGYQRCTYDDPLCKQVSQLYDTKDEEDKKRASNLRAKNHAIFNVVDLDGDLDIVLTWVASPGGTKKIIKQLQGGVDSRAQAVGLEGDDFHLDYDTSRKGADTWDVTLRLPGNSKKLPAALLEQVKDFFTSEQDATLPGGKPAAKKSEPKVEKLEEEVKEDTLAPEPPETSIKAPSKKANGRKRRPTIRRFQAKESGPAEEVAPAAAVTDQSPDPEVDEEEKW